MRLHTCLAALHGAALAPAAAAAASPWSLASDPTTGRPQRLIGGAIPLLASPADDAVAAARGSLAANAELLALDVATLRPADPALIRSRDGHLLTLRFEIAPQGVPVDGAHVIVVVSHGNVISTHLTGTAPVLADLDAPDELRAETSAGSARGAALLFKVRAPDRRQVACKRPSCPGTAVAMSPTSQRAPRPGAPDLPSLPPSPVRLREEIR